MLNQTIDILTSYQAPQKRCMLGNVAVARGAIEAGVQGVFSYPGTPSTEISEVFNYVSRFQQDPKNTDKFPGLTANPVYFEYSINEKIAFEKAIAYAIGNKNALCIMKNVGLNVASDALMSIPYQTIEGALVAIVCDDPGCHSSSNEQDSRYWGKMASVPVFNPADPATALEQTRAAFQLSAMLKLPVIVRLTTRVSHTRNMIEYGSISSQVPDARFIRRPENINIPARTASAHKLLLHKLQASLFDDYFNAFNVIGIPPGSRLGIITSGVSGVYVNEVLGRSVQPRHFAHLQLGLIHPFPELQVGAFLQKGFDKVVVIEELDPIIENEVRLIAHKLNLGVSIYGKGFSGMEATGELSLEDVERILLDSSGDHSLHSETEPLPGLDGLLQAYPARPPALCAGCPHRATFYALKLIVPRDVPEIVLCGDIGCNGLGALPPLKMIDTINHMGMSVSMAQGLSAAFESSGAQSKTIAMLGDGTFFHSGIASLLNAVYTRANILVIIFDNRTIGMTGHQDHPGATRKSRYKEIHLLPVIKGIGVDFVESIDPFDLTNTVQTLEKAMQVEGVSVVIAQAPCIFLPQYKEGHLVKRKIVVDAAKCNTCGNHLDPDIDCSRCYDPLNNLSRARQKVTSWQRINAREQLCPANICNHGFFNSIIEGDYKEAVHVVRDKMLFSRTCGDICHRPCETLSESGVVAPIKRLKRMVSSSDERFFDISPARNKVRNAVLKNKRIAIVGAGPAGLSAAYDLVKEGYEIDLFDKQSMPGGMLRYIIPNFRMDKGGLDFETSIPQELGVNFHGNKSLGTDIELAALCEHYDAVILAIGLWKPKTLAIIEEGIPGAQRHDALSFLKAFNGGNLQQSSPLTYLIIGGGNSAVDVARSALSLNTENTVHLLCMESRANMPAFDEEIREAEKEGVQLHTECVVSSCETVNGRIQVRATSAVSGQDIFIGADHLVTAIGQLPDRGAYPLLASDTDSDGFVQTHSGECNTLSFANLFVAGDLGKGNHQSVIGAVGSGRKAATGVRRYLENYTYEYEGNEALDKLKASGLTYHKPAPDYRNDQELLKEISKLDVFQHCARCNHCLDNFGCPAMVRVDGKIVIDEQKCTLCGLCIDVCPNDAIRFEETIVAI